MIQLDDVAAIDADRAIAAAIWSLVLAGHLDHRLEKLREYALAAGIRVECIEQQRAMRPRTTLTRPTRVAPSGVVDGKRQCSRCKQWRLVEDFPFKSARAQGVRRSYCKSCWSTKNKESWLSKPKKDAMAEAGVRFAFIHDGQVALVCATCDQPIGPGERAIMHGTVIHARCNR